MSIPIMSMRRSTLRYVTRNKIYSQLVYTLSDLRNAYVLSLRHKRSKLPVS
jgi:hypothetical protein